MGLTFSCATLTAVVGLARTALPRRDVLAMAFAPDGKTLVTGSFDDTIKERYPPNPELGSWAVGNYLANNGLGPMVSHYDPRRSVQRQGVFMVNSTNSRCGA